MRAQQHNATYVTITQPEHLIHAVPYLLGFHPKESVVLIWVRAGSIVLTQRFDIGDLAPTSLLQSAADRVAATDVFICVFRDDQPDEEFLQGVKALAGTFDSVIDALVVFGDRWTSALCSERCCSVNGRIIDPQVGDEIAVEFIAQGVNVLPSRQDLLEEISLDDVCVLMAPEFEGEPISTQDEVKDYVARIVQCWRQIPEPFDGHTLPDQVLLHVHAFRSTAVRDDLLCLLAELPTSNLRPISAMLSGVLRATPDGPAAADIASTLAIVHWLIGDGARAWVSLDRALAIEADHSLANLVSRALTVGLPPSTWRSFLTQVNVDRCASLG